MSSLSDAFRAHPMYVDHDKQIDLNSLQELPDSYAWIPVDDHTYPSNCRGDDDTIPIIDLNDAVNASELIGQACKTWGVFQVTNHGIPTKLLDDIEFAAKTLFSLPPEQKLKAARSPDGNSGFGLARISPFFPKHMWYEGFTIVDSPVDHFQQLWPQDYTKYCDIVFQYKEALKKLAEKLTWLMLGSLGISKEDIEWAGPKGDFEGAAAALQLNAYPPCPDPDRAMGLAAHTDSTLLTILYQNNISGLEVLREGTGWVMVPPLPGALVVNVGDLLHVLSNGLYRSVLHRAVVNRTSRRFSVAYLYGPPGTVQIAPHPKVVGPSRPPMYRSVTWNEYLGKKAKLFTKALPSIQICAPTNTVAEPR